MSRKFIFVTGTGTGVGKTVFATLLVRQLQEQGVSAIGLKPVCSGGREDAVHLWKAGGKRIGLDEVNPWHYEAGLAPVLAAREEGKRLGKAEVVRRVRAVGRDFDRVVVEGAGGLLSPTGEGFDSRDLILQLAATPIVVTENKLGAVNQVRLVMDALPARCRKQAQVILFEGYVREKAGERNAALLAEFFPERRIHVLPWIENWTTGEGTVRPELWVQILSRL